MASAGDHTEHTRRIISYLSYLRDISRKVVSRSGFEKCLLNRATGYALQIDEINFELAPTAPNYQKIKTYLDSNSIASSNDKKLFLGLGTFAGTSKRIFAAPLILIQCEVIEINHTIIIEPGYDTMSLNYDFIASISTNYLNAEEDDAPNTTFAAEQQTIEEVEKKLRETGTKNTPIEALNSFFATLTDNAFKELANNLEYFKGILQTDKGKYQGGTH